LVLGFWLLAFGCWLLGFSDPRHPRGSAVNVFFFLPDFCLIRVIRVDQSVGFAFALNNVKRGPYKIKPLPYILRFFRKALTAVRHLADIAKSFSNFRLLFADCCLLILKP